MHVIKEKIYNNIISYDIIIGYLFCDRKRLQKLLNYYSISENLFIRAMKMNHLLTKIVI